MKSSAKWSIDVLCMLTRSTRLSRGRSRRRGRSRCRAEADIRSSFGSGPPFPVDNPSVPVRRFRPARGPDHSGRRRPEPDRHHPPDRQPRRLGRVRFGLWGGPDGGGSEPSRPEAASRPVLARPRGLAPIPPAAAGDPIGTSERSTDEDLDIRVHRQGHSSERGRRGRGPATT
jgi:hypothetical protein